MIRLEDLTPDASRAERTRQRCRAVLERQRPTRRDQNLRLLRQALTSAAVGTGGLLLVFYLGELVLTTLRVYGFAR